MRDNFKIKILNCKLYQELNSNNSLKFIKLTMENHRTSNIELLFKEVRCVFFCKKNCNK